MNRKKFVAALALMPAVSLVSCSNPQRENASLLTEAAAKTPISHHVFFWLKNPGSSEDLRQLIAGLRTLKNIEVVKEIRIGIPAQTEQRAVVENSFSVSELLFFENIEAQAIYQSHPIHLQFVENCSHLWEKVVVYDVEEAA